jgi:Fe-S-cluster containining protein
MTKPAQTSRAKTIPIAIDPANKCAACHGSLCCTYITHQIATPRSKLDFSNLLWQVAHQGVQLYRDGGIWFLLFEGRCAHLQNDGRCAIYATRPQACRDHSNENCEFGDGREVGFDLHFEHYQDLLKYCKKKFKNWDETKVK